MFCVYCGAKLEEYEKFCHNCGKKVNVWKEAEQKVEILSEEDEQTRLTESDSGIQTRDVPKANSDKEKQWDTDLSTFDAKRKERENKQLILGVILATVVIFLAIIIIIRQEAATKNGEKLGESASNESVYPEVSQDFDMEDEEIPVSEGMQEENEDEDGFVRDYEPGEENHFGIGNAGLAAKGSFIVSQGDWLYYTYQEKIYKRREGEAPILVADTGAACLNVCGDYVYYAVYHPGITFSIERIRTDGKDREELVTDGAGTEPNFIVDGEKGLIWYVGEDYNGSAEPYPCYKKFDMNTGNTETVYTLQRAYSGKQAPRTLKLCGLSEAEGFIYGAEGYGDLMYQISRIDMESGKYECILEEGNSSVGMTEQYIFYFKNNTFKKYDIEEGKMLNEINIHTLSSPYISAVNEDALIYALPSYPGRMAITYGEDDFPVWEDSYIRFSDDMFARASLVGDWVYYFAQEENPICRINIWDRTWEMFMDDSMVISDTAW